VSVLSPMSTSRLLARRPALVLAFSLFMAAVGCTGALNDGDAGSGPTDAAEPFVCGNASCVSGREYCFSEEWDGTTKIAPECRALPAGCSTCDCAESDAESVSLSCKGARSLTCINRGVVIDYNTSSPTLTLACLIP